MKTWEKNIRRVEPYVPGEQPKVKDVVKLNTNENPYPPTPKVHEAAERMNISDLRLYPDPEVTDLVHAIAAYYGMNDNQDTLQGQSGRRAVMNAHVCTRPVKPG